MLFFKCISQTTHYECKTFELIDICNINLFDCICFCSTESLFSDMLQLCQPVHFPLWKAGRRYADTNPQTVCNWCLFGIIRLSECIVCTYTSGIQWSNMYISPLAGDTSSFGWLCWLLLIDSLVYFIIGIYIRMVFPGNVCGRGLTGHGILGTSWDFKRSIEDFNSHGEFFFFYIFCFKL